MNLLAPTLQAYVTDRPTRQRQASPSAPAARPSIRLAAKHATEISGRTAPMFGTGWLREARGE